MALGSERALKAIPQQALLCQTQPTVGPVGFLSILWDAKAGKGCLTSLEPGIVTASTCTGRQARVQVQSFESSPKQAHLFYSHQKLLNSLSND